VLSIHDFFVLGSEFLMVRLDDKAELRAKNLVERYLTGRVDTGRSHVLGFKIFEDFADRESAHFRVHEWRDGGFDSPDFHNHAWSYSSLVIRGQIQNQVLVEAPELRKSPCIAVEKHICRSMGREIDTIGHAHLELVSSEVYNEGDFYSMNLDQIHNVKVISDFAVTLMIRGPYRRDWSLVYRPLTHPSSTPR
jgi:hypothetical protein